MDTPASEATVTVTATIVVRPEPYLTTEDKEAQIKQILIDQLASDGNTYDWGLSLEGTVSSSLTDPVDVSYSKPDYVEVPEF